MTLSEDRRHLLDGFRMVDLARKVVGVGSVGTNAWIVLLLGRDADDALFLQAKEAQASVLEDYLAPSAHDSAGERVVAGQRLMQASSDIFLGWQRVPAELSHDGVSRDYYVRQLADMKGSARVERMDAADLKRYGRLCGWTLARAHARSGDRIAIAGYLGRSSILRPRHRRVRQHLRRPERTRPRRACPGRERRPRHRAGRLARALPPISEATSAA